MALSGCLFAIALPATAGARPIDFQPTQQHVAAIAAASQYHPHGRPAAYAGQQYTLPAGFQSDAQSNAKPTSPAPTSSIVVREVQPQGNNDHTLAIVLASCALGIALCGAAFAVIRTGRLQRRLAETSS
jgi:hypothetical protein